MSLKFRNGAKHTSHIGQLIGTDLYCSLFAVVSWRVVVLFLISCIVARHTAVALANTAVYHQPVCHCRPAIAMVDACLIAIAMSRRLQALWWQNIVHHHLNASLSYLPHFASVILYFTCHCPALLHCFTHLKLTYSTNPFNKFTEAPMQLGTDGMSRHILIPYTGYSRT